MKRPLHWMSLWPGYLIKPLKSFCFKQIRKKTNYCKLNRPFWAKSSDYLSICHFSSSTSYHSLWLRRGRASKTMLMILMILAIMILMVIIRIILMLMTMIMMICRAFYQHLPGPHHLRASGSFTWSIVVISINVTFMLLPANDRVQFRPVFKHEIKHF